MNRMMYIYEQETGRELAKQEESGGDELQREGEKTKEKQVHEHREQYQQLY